MDDGEIQIFAPVPKQAAVSSNPPIGSSTSVSEDTARDVSTENGYAGSSGLAVIPSTAVRAVSSGTPPPILEAPTVTRVLNKDPAKHLSADSESKLNERAASPGGVQADPGLGVKSKPGLDGASRPAEGASVKTKKAVKVAGGGCVETFKSAHPVCDEQSVKEINDAGEVEEYLPASESRQCL